MLLRIREKEAKRKTLDVESTAKKKRCEREERITLVQLKAYWDTFPLPLQVDEAAEIPAPSSDDDELLEEPPSKLCVSWKPGTSQNDHEIIVEPERRDDKSYSRIAANCARRDLVKALHISIEDKTETDAKKRKLDPQNSRVGTDPSDINREVDHALKDPLQARIHPGKTRSNTKRALSFDGTSLGCKATKREAQAILNICGAGMPRVTDPKT